MIAKVNVSNAADEQSELEGKMQLDSSVGRGSGAFAAKSGRSVAARTKLRRTDPGQPRERDDAADESRDEDDELAVIVDADWSNQIVSTAMQHALTLAVHGQ